MYDMEEYFSGKKLFGNDFSYQQIEKWYDEEAEAYAELGNQNRNDYSYDYNQLNIVHGFKKLNKDCFNNVLGFGSAWGDEFMPIIQKINKLTIVEPSDKMINNRLGNLTPMYIKPSIDGKLNFDDNSFDLITCFGTLHHIPNVSFVLSELIRVLMPNGYLLIREPIISMGDWRQRRKGLTKNERGIPVHLFDAEFRNLSVKIESKTYCFTLTAYLQRFFGTLFKKPVYSYKAYILFDKIISNILKNNVHYHATKKIHRIAPGSVFYVLKKYPEF